MYQISQLAKRWGGLDMRTHTEYKFWDCLTQRVGWPDFFLPRGSNKQLVFLRNLSGLQLCLGGFAIVGYQIRPARLGTKTMETSKTDGEGMLGFKTWSDVTFLVSSQADVAKLSKSSLFFKRLGGWDRGLFRWEWSSNFSGDLMAARM